MGLLQPTLQTQQHLNIDRTQSWSTFADNFSSDTECALSWHWQWQAGPACLRGVERTAVSHGQTQKFLWLHENIWICRLLILPELQRISLHWFSFAGPISTKFSPTCDHQRCLAQCLQNRQGCWKAICYLLCSCQCLRHLRTWLPIIP